LVRPLLLFALEVIGLSLSGTASAASVHWSAPDNCPKDVFVFSLEQTLERRVEDIVDVEISLGLEGSGNAWSVEFSLGPHPATGSPATRRLEGTSCADVSRAAAVAVAMALHAGGRVQVAAPEDSSEPANPEPPEAERGHEANAEVESPGEPSPEAVWSVPVSAGLVVDGALLGELALGYTVGLGIIRRRWELGVNAVLLPQTLHATSDGLAVKLDALLGVASLCARVGDPPASPRLCVGYELGRLHGEGSGPGLRSIYSRRATWQAVRADLGVDVPLTGDLALGLTGGAALALTKARFVFDDGPVAHQLPRFSGRGTVVLRWVF
jgi:hypothetical protein